MSCPASWETTGLSTLRMNLAPSYRRFASRVKRVEMRLWRRRISSWRRIGISLWKKFSWLLRRRLEKRRRFLSRRTLRRTNATTDAPVKKLTGPTLKSDKLLKRSNNSSLNTKRKSTESKDWSTQLKLASAQTKSPTSKLSTKQSGLAWPPNTKPTLLHWRLGKKLSGKCTMR